MITSRYVDGVAIPDFDAAITAVVEDSSDDGGQGMVIAIENDAGKVYRIVETLGMGAFIRTTQAVLGLGFVDTLADSLQGKSGYDCRMVPSLDLLRKTIEQRQSNDPSSDILTAMNELSALQETERQAIIRSRVGQGRFREGVIEHWRQCAVTGATCIDLLKASHIKPWRDATNSERLDPSNGLLLVPNLDAAFDAGRITFDGDGRIVLSRQMRAGAAYQLHISEKMRIDQKRLSAEHHKYLEYHQQHVFENT